jgi:hypothetical protein
MENFIRLIAVVVARFIWLIVLAQFAPQPQLVKAQSSETPLQVENHFDSRTWLSDFHELIEAMDAHYADLDWALHDRHMDLPKLRQETEDKIRNSGDDQAARRAFEQFLNAFGDGHLSISWPRDEVAASPNASRSKEPLCRRLGYKDPNKKGVDFSLLPGFSSVPGDGTSLFSGGLITLPHRKLGLIRIAYFNEHGFPGACEEALGELHLNDESACDRDCARAINLKAANLLTARIVGRARELRSQGASALLIDLTHNDGGDDWNEAVARSLSRIPLIDERRGFLRVPSWTTKLESDLHTVESDINNGAEPTNVLAQAATQLEAAIVKSKDPCDRGRAFEDGTVMCSLVVDQGFYWSGLISYAKPGSFASLKSRTMLFNPLQYDYVESANRLPLFVLVDAHSWSSAERFAALLQDNHSATIVGELTGGAGCGFVDGGIPTTLTHSHAEVAIPNCVGLRKDGSNANNGVTPDIFVPWAARDTLYTRAEKVILALDKAHTRQFDAK